MQISDDALEKWANNMRDLAAKYAEAKAEMEYLDNFRHSKLAILMKEFEKQGFQTSVSQDREARAHPDYIDLLEGLRVATQDAERVRWELRIAEAKSSIWQTVQSTKRAEMRAYGQ